jgi:hypothetical protein
MKRSNLKKLNGVETKEEYQVKISNSFGALGNLNGDYGGEVGISRAWKIIREITKASTTESLGYYELKQDKNIV